MVRKPKRYNELHFIQMSSVWLCYTKKFCIYFPCNLDPHRHVSQHVILNVCMLLVCGSVNVSNN